MTCLVLRSEAPLQCWGLPADGDVRPTSDVPTKSGIIGLIASAQGIERGGDLSHLRSLRMSVRVDKPGRIFHDLHTVSYLPGMKSPKNPLALTDKDYDAYDSGARFLRFRDFLADASFLVFLEGDERVLAEACVALRAPVYAPHLGSPSCPPSVPVLVGLYEDSASDLIATLEVPETDEPLRVIRDAAQGERGSLVMDIPLSTKLTNRSFSQRVVVEELVSPKEEPTSSTDSYFDTIASLKDSPC